MQIHRVQTRFTVFVINLGVRRRSFFERSKPLQGKPSVKSRTNERKTLLEKPARKVEDIYQKKTPLEHVLLRPDTYIGSVERDKAKLWVMNEKEMQMEYRTLSYVPALYKIFDEILVNAADNKMRDSAMDLLKVDIDKKTNTITVWNNGKGLPVVIHEEQKLYVPEMVFGMLLTSSNYNDHEKKITGGRNGYGAKLTNIFSQMFTVETYDSTTGRLFTKTWQNNMQDSTPAVTKEIASKDYTCVTFKPDLSKFGMKKLEDDIVALMKKRVWDMAGCTPPSVKVQLNGKVLPINDFKDYCQLYPLGVASIDQHFEVVNDRWTVCAVSSDRGFQQVSFVNCVWTLKGGKHVDHIVSQITDRLAEKISKKKYDFKPVAVKNNLWVFVNCLIENPSFNSQTKETLTTTNVKFGSTCMLSESFLKTVESNILSSVIASHESKMEGELNRLAKTSGRNRSKRVTGIPKLEEANEAGTSRARECTLVLTEGDSAKALAVSGFSIVGRDLWGVFPLRGKLLNVREASTASILKNQEIQSIMKILGLQVGVKYTSTDKLRYGHLMIMADQDHDGSHIKGLLVNFIHYFWPELLENCPGFLVQFITPIVKVSKGHLTKSFFSMPEYHKWFESTPDYSKYKIKYYKGLGTSSPEEAKKYFQELQIHRVVFDYVPKEDTDSITLAFDKNRVEDRKVWLTSYTEGDCVDYRRKHLQIREFINKELILFSRADCERSIPSVVDGFKPSLRKILFCCFKKRGMDKHEIKVAQLSGYVSEHSAYHHGEASLQNTIIGMAQDFVGANNVNFLQPVGQFGTRIEGGKDASQPRYLFTHLTPLARAAFPAEDDSLLKYRDDDGISVEPYWYVPVIPTLLVNGCKGIGTGFATSIPMYNPAELVQHIKGMLQGTDLCQLHPWYRGFTGVIEKNVDGKYRCYGRIARVSRTVVNITELPVEKWTSDYKSFLEDLLAREIIYEYREHHTDNTVDFEVQMDQDTLDEWEKQGLQKTFGLISIIPVSNLVCFDIEGRIRKYETVTDIIKDFFQIRMEFYRKRKDFLVSRLNSECTKLQNMIRFVLEVVDKKLDVLKRKKKDVLADLKSRGYKPFPAATHATQQQEDTTNAEAVEDEDASTRDYDYLLGMRIWALTHERVEQLQNQVRQKERELDLVLRTSPESMWTTDLDNFLALYKSYEEKRLKNMHAHEHETGADEVLKSSKKGKASNGKEAVKKSSVRLADSTYVPKRSEKHTNEPSEQPQAQKRAREVSRGARGVKPAH